MAKNFQQLIDGYQKFRKKYAVGDESVMQQLAEHGQQPNAMIIACSDSRVDPSLILQCEPGDLFIVRNVANIVPPYEKDLGHHGVSAALEFGICYLRVNHLIILGHSQCGGIEALLHGSELEQNDFIGRWVSLIKLKQPGCDRDDCAKQALLSSYHNCATFPWIKERVEKNELQIHVWYFSIQEGELLHYDFDKKSYVKLF